LTVRALEVWCSAASAHILEGALGQQRAACTLTRRRIWRLALASPLQCVPTQDAV